MANRNDDDSSSSSSSSRPHSIVPIPDPTILTTQQLFRELATQREILEARLDGMDHATALLQVAANKIPNEVDTKVEHLQALHEEKFRSIEIQFKERDVRTEQTSRDAKTAVDAALQAAKEAVGKQNDSFTLATAKSEANFTKQIEQLASLLANTTKSLDDKITDAKERLTRIEGNAVGQSTAKVTQQETHGLNLSAIAVVVSVAAVIVSIIIAVVMKMT